MNFYRFVSYAIIAGGVVLSTQSNSFAAAIAADLHSASGLGNSYAGSVTGSHDITDNFTNPAAISQLDRPTAVLSMSYLSLDIDSDRHGGVSNLTSTSLTGSRTGDSGVDSIVPAAFFAFPINKDTVAGLNVTAPFALATKYDQNWVGRYQAVDSEIVTANINPYISHKVYENLSVGFGLQAQYMKARLTNATDVGLGSDLMYKYKGDDWGYGFNLGAKYSLNDQIDFGVGYRSKIKHKLSGASYLDPLASASSTADMTTPETITLGALYKYDSRFDFAYDLMWMRWSSMKNNLDINSTNSLLSASSSLNWNDSFRHSLGATYKYDDKLKLRFGTAYEKEAVNTNNRTPRIPTGNRVWLSGGLGYKINDNLNLDLAYMHQFHKTTRSSNQATTESSGTSLDASYKTNVDVIAVGFAMSF